MEIKLKHSQESLTSRRRLEGRTEQRGSQTGFPSWGAFLFGSIFVVIGSIIILIGTRVIPVLESSVHAPYWILTVFGMVFVLGGFAVWTMAWKQYRAHCRCVEAMRNYPGEPAFADYDWNPRGFEVSRWKKPIQAFVGTLFLTLFLSIFNYWAFIADGPWLVKLVVSLFDLIGIAVWWETALRFGRALKFGGSGIIFDRFPYQLTEPILIRWKPADGIDQINGGFFTLRCVEEWFESHGSGENDSASLVHEEIWKESWLVDEVSRLSPGSEVMLRFEPATDVLPTNLSGKRPVFLSITHNSE